SRDTCPSLAPRLLSPSWDATSTTPLLTLRWAPSDAIAYRVWAATPGSQPRLVGTTTGMEITARLAGGLTFWWVEAEFGSGCPPLRSESRRVHVQSTMSRRRAV